MCSISVSRKISKIDPLFMQDNRSSKELRFFLRHRLDDDFEIAALTVGCDGELGPTVHNGCLLHMMVPGETRHKVISTGSF